MTAEIAVTAMEAVIRGKIPNSGGSEVGYQYLPNKNSLTETFPKMGSPSKKRKKTIRVRIVIEARAML
jgi:hypothetical protein